MKTKLIILCAIAIAILAMAVVAQLYSNPNHGGQVTYASDRYADMRAIRPGSDSNRITKENEWHAAFAAQSQELYGSQVTQRTRGRIFSTNDEEASEAEIKGVIETLRH